ncbi:MAG: hypothetical protein Q7Q73_13485 [Verrucomicrobiota bacterium JB024]|nr:hypothetical protein [Verrucomicrobiota bacterium JB024]
MMKTSSYLLMGSLAAGFTLTAQAAVLVSYETGNAYVSADTTFNTTATQTGSSPYTYVNAFSDTTQLSPATDYTGPTFYGGYEFSSSTVARGITRQQIRNYAEGDQIYMQSFNSGGWLNSVLSLHGIYVFLQQDFNSGYNTGSISLEGVSMIWDGYGNTAGSESFDFEGRLAIQINGTYYLSDLVIDLSQYNGNVDISGTTLTNAKWAAYTPSADLDFDAGSASFIDLELTSITAVGIYFEEDGWNGTDAANAAYGFGIESFTATGSVIPEPSQMGALLGAVCLLSVLVARRRTKS